VEADLARFGAAVDEWARSAASAGGSLPLPDASVVGLEALCSRLGAAGLPASVVGCELLLAAPASARRSPAKERGE
jgi:hypothetical protein